MTRKGFRYLVCPDCSHRSVSVKHGSDDGWDCRNNVCEFYAYTGGNDSIDVIRRKRLLEVNPELAELIWVGDCYCDYHEGNMSTCPEHSTIEQFVKYRASLGTTI